MTGVFGIFRFARLKGGCHMLSEVLKIGVKFIISALGIVFVGALPSLFNGMSLDFSSYINQIVTAFSQLLNPGQLVYIEKSGERPLFPHLFAPYFYSMIELDES